MGSYPADWVCETSTAGPGARACGTLPSPCDRLSVSKGARTSAIARDQVATSNPKPATANRGCERLNNCLPYDLVLSFLSGRGHSEVTIVRHCSHQPIAPHEHTPTSRTTAPPLRPRPWEPCKSASARTFTWTRCRVIRDQEGVEEELTTRV